MSERFEQIRDFFDQLIGVPPSEWPQRLEEAAPHDAGVRSEVLALLRLAHAHAAERPSSATSAESLPDHNLGTAIGPFRLSRLIGHGGMGNVYLGERTDGFRQQVAVKLVRRGFDTDEVLRRFRLERQVLAQLNHPHIARLVDGGETADGSPYFAMEYVNEALPITEYCDRHKMTIRERLRLFASVCRAVHAAHQNTILHRDLKPGNILVDRTGTPKLVDFGIAKLLGAEATGETQTSSAVPGLGPMTPEYASPEQFLGQPVTTASDVYALGIVLYELLVGQRPYDGANRSNLESLRRAVVETPAIPPSHRLIATAPKPELSDQPRPAGSLDSVTATRSTTLRDLRRQLSRELETLVLYPLNKEPQRRYASAEAFAEDIERFLSGQSVRAVPATVRYRVSTFVRRNRALVGGIAATFLALLAGGITSFALYLRAERNAVAAAKESAKWRSATELLDQTLLSSHFGNLRQSVRFGDVLKRLGHVADGVATLQPEVAASALAIQGSNYQMADDLVAAYAALKRAAELKAGLLGSSHPDVAILRARVGIVDIGRGRLAEAAPLIDEAVTVLRPHREAHPDYLAETLLALAQVRAFGGSDRRLCESICHEALSLLSEANEKHLDERASAWIVLSQIAYQNGDYSAAIAHSMKALPLCQAAFGESHTYTLIVANNLAFFLTESGRADEAKRLYVDLVGRARMKLADDPAQLVSLLNFAGRSLDYKLGEHELAASMNQEALAIGRATLGEGHPLTAEAQLEAALKMRNSGGRASPEAADRIRPALQVLARELGEDHPTVLLGQFNFARALYHRNVDVKAVNRADLQEACNALEVVLPCLERLGPRPDVFVSVNEVAHELSIVYSALDMNAPRAVELARRAAEGYRGSNSHDALLMGYRLVRALLRAGDVATAEETYHPYAAQAAIKYPNVPHLVWFGRSTLARLRIAQERFPEAEAALLDADSIIRSDPANAGRWELASLRESLIELYDAWHAIEPGAGYDAKADALR